MNQQLINMLYTPAQRTQAMTFNQCLELLWSQNLLATGELAEQALVKKSRGVIKQNTRNRKASDFTDNSEHKYSTVQYNSRYCGRAQITGLKNKTGLLRVMVYEPRTGKNYFFRVPHSVYSRVTSPKIYFDLEGQPRDPVRKDANFNMWQYKCTVAEWAAK